ncbi:MAG: GMP synthase [Bacteroidetes bacterium]|nr:MAG: GMP synthase [Bacteroidota bacterium]
MLKIAVLDMYEGHANEGMRCIRQLIQDFLSKEGIQGKYEVFDVRLKNELPDLSYDVFISSGGPGSPLPSDAEWEKNYFRLIHDIFAHNRTSENKKFVFLICHSFQMVSNHFGLGIVSKRKSTSFGVMPMHRTDDGFTETCFSGLPEPFYAVDSRDYQLIQPNWKNIDEFGAKILAHEKIRPEVPLERAVMAIRFSDEIIGTQFHPEADSIGMLHHYQKEEKKKIVIEAFGEEKYYQMLAHLDDPDKITLTESIIIPKFLERAAEQLMGVQLA